MKKIVCLFIFLLFIPFSYSTEISQEKVEEFRKDMGKVVNRILYDKITYKKQH